MDWLKRLDWPLVAYVTFITLAARFLYDKLHENTLLLLVALIATNIIAGLAFAATRKAA